MKEFIKHNPATLDNVETMANAMIESMRFVDNTLDYPEAEKARPNDGVEPEWFYDAYYGAIPTSELTAIIQYTQQRMLFENIGETFLGIAFVEMKHFDRLGDFIGQLGGRVNTPKYSSSAVTVEYESAAEAIRVNIQAEKDTIAAYQQLIERIRKNNPEKLTQSATVAIQLLNKIVSDERVHVRILSELAQSVAAEEGKRGIIRFPIEPVFLECFVSLEIRPERIRPRMTGKRDRILGDPVAPRSMECRG